MDKKEINELIAEKVMGLVKQVDFGEWNEHDWEHNEDGEIDTWAFEYMNHNGPRCERCWYDFCENCDPHGYDNNDCKKDAPKYTDSIVLAFKVAEKLKDKYFYLLNSCYVSELDFLKQESKFNSEGYIFTYCGKNNNPIEASAQADTIEMAICLATIDLIENEELFNRNEV